METLILFIAAAILASLIIPWVNFKRINRLEAENERLRKIVHRLAREKDSLQPAPPAAEAEDAPVGEKAETQTDSTAGAGKPTAAPAPEAPASTPSNEVPKPTTPVAPQPTSGDKSGKEEEKTDWFGKLTVWVGGVAMLMAGFFMIRYSIESGWMTPAVRLWLTTIFGGLLCASGLLLERRVSVRANRAIGQALAGAGVACLYFSSYAAVHLYEFITTPTGFVAMVGVTIIAVALSLRLGVPIALMGLIGGFLTPFLMAGENPSTTLLLSYTFLVFLGAQILSFLRRSAILLFTSLVGAFGWTLLLLLSPAETVGPVGNEILIFLLGIVATNTAWTVLAQKSASPFFRSPFSRAARWIIWVVVFPQGLWALWSTDFNFTTLLLYSVLATGALILGWIREKDFAPIALLALFFVLSAGLLAESEIFWRHSAWIVGMSLIFGVTAFLKIRRSESDSPWVAISLISTSFCVLTAYLNSEFIHPTAIARPSLWLTGFLLSAAVAIGQAESHRLRDPSRPDRAGAFSAAAFFLCGIGFWIFAAFDCLSFWVAALILGATLLWRWRDREFFPLTVGTLLIFWVYTMTDRIAQTFDFFFQGSPMSIGSTPALLGGWDALAWLSGLLAAGFSLTKSVEVEKDHWKRFLERFTVLAGIATVTAASGVFLPADAGTIQQTQISAGVLTSAFAALGATFLLTSNRWPAGNALSALCLGIVAFRIVIVHLFSPGAYGERFFGNALLWQFGIPLLAFAIASVFLLRNHRSGRFSNFCLGCSMAISWVWVTFLIQDFFGSSALFSWVQTDAEMYAYSVSWLVLAIVFQSIGLWRNLRILHIGSLILLLITVGKVFVIDTSTLTGLFRVLSFFGLGLALLGIGFFYNKVVFARRGK